MASHRHHHHHHHQHSHHNCCSCCYSPCCTTDPSSAPTSNAAAAAAAATDPLLQAIAAHLLQSSPPPPSHHPHVEQYLKFQYLHHHRQQQHPHAHPQEPPPPPPQQQSQSLLIQSLLRRVAALETSLPHLSSPPPPPPTKASPPRRPQPPPPSIRDLAARTIQAHFRLHLVRRSQTLRHLKHLASVRSHVAVLKSSLSGGAHLSPESLSQGATDLLIQLDSIQSSDPMIREGKRSISRELVRLLEFAGGVSLRRGELPLKSMEIARSNPDRRAPAERSSPRASQDDGGAKVENLKRQQVSSSRPSKRVSFKENGQKSRVPTTNGESFTDEEIAGYSIDKTVLGSNGKASVEELGDLTRVSGAAVDGHWEEEEEEGGGGGGGGGERGGLHQISDEEKSSGDNRVKAGVRFGVNGSSRSQQAHLMGLSAPLPVQMEPRSSDR